MWQDLWPWLLGALLVAMAAGALWLALARLRLDQGQRDLAAELARRAESLAAPGSTLRRQAQVETASSPWPSPPRRHWYQP